MYVITSTKPQPRKYMELSESSIGAGRRGASVWESSVLPNSFFMTIARSGLPFAAFQVLPSAVEIVVQGSILPYWSKTVLSPLFEERSRTLRVAAACNAECEACCHAPASRPYQESFVQTKSISAPFFAIERPSSGKTSS